MRITHLKKCLKHQKIINLYHSMKIMEEIKQQDIGQEILPVIFKEKIEVKESGLEFVAAKLMEEIDKQIIKKLNELVFDDKGKERTKAQIIKMLK